jgi:transposase
MKLSVGVDLHKGQFTVYWRSESEEIREWEKYSTTESEYERFERKLALLCDAGYRVSVAVESTGNTRYFRNRIERLGVPVVVINTLKFKVVTESVKKTDRQKSAPAGFRRSRRTEPHRRSGRAAHGNDRSAVCPGQEVGEADC